MDQTPTVLSEPLVKQFPSKKLRTHYKQCNGINKRTGSRCMNSALMEYIGTRPDFCAEHIDQEPNALYTKCGVLYEKLNCGPAKCKELVLKDFGFCFKHFDNFLKKFFEPRDYLPLYEKLIFIDAQLKTLLQEAGEAKSTEKFLYQRKYKLTAKTDSMKVQVIQKLHELWRQVLDEIGTTGISFESIQNQTGVSLLSLLETRRLPSPNEFLSIYQFILPNCERQDQTSTIGISQNLLNSTQTSFTQPQTQIQTQTQMLISDSIIIPTPKFHFYKNTTIPPLSSSTIVVPRPIFPSSISQKISVNHSSTSSTSTSPSPSHSPSSSSSSSSPSIPSLLLSERYGLGGCLNESLEGIPTLSSTNSSTSSSSRNCGRVGLNMICNENHFSSSSSSSKLISTNSCFSSIPLSSSSSTTPSNSITSSPSTSPISPHSPPSSPSPSSSSTTSSSPSSLTSSSSSLSLSTSSSHKVPNFHLNQYSLSCSSPSTSIFSSTPPMSPSTSFSTLSISSPSSPHERCLGYSNLNLLLNPPYEKYSFSSIFDSHRKFELRVRSSPEFFSEDTDSDDEVERKPYSRDLETPLPMPKVMLPTFVPQPFTISPDFFDKFHKRKRESNNE